MKLSHLLALRFIKNNAQENTISFMIKVCFVSIMLASCALTLVAAIMQGFEVATHKKLQGINADITLRSPRPLDAAKIDDIIKTEFNNVIKASSPLAIGQIIIQQNNKQAHLSNVIALFGIDPENYSKVGNFNKTLIAGITDINQLTDKQIAIGQTLAKNSSLKVGDSITLFYPETETVEKNSISLASRAVTIGAIFKTGIEEFDEQIIYCSLELFEDLYDFGVRQYVIMLYDGVDNTLIKEKLIKRLGIEGFTWQEMYPALIAALGIEKYVAFLVLSLMALLACMTIVSVLFMLITQKKTDIAILKAMGMKTKDLITVFTTLGTLLCFSASVIGIVLAYCLSLILQYYPIPLPDAYYVSELPIHITPVLIMFIIGLLTIMGFLASWYTARRIRNMQVTSIFKHEN